MRWMIAICLVCAIAACNGKTKAPQILSREKMTEVTWHMILVDEYSNSHIYTQPVKDLNRQRLPLYAKVFKLHGISREDYAASLKYYAARPDVMKVIFDSLSARGDRERQKTLPK